MATAIVICLADPNSLIYSRDTGYSLQQERLKAYTAIVYHLQTRSSVKAKIDLPRRIVYGVRCSELYYVWCLVIIVAHPSKVQLNSKETGAQSRFIYRDIG